MREIKFRCFYRGQMYPVKEMQFSPDGSFCVSIIEMELEGVRDVSPDSEHVKGIMQSTGLLDKNGKEIYEHDIITFGNNRNYKVVFEDGAFILLHHGRLKQSDHDGLKDFDGTPLRWGLLSRAHELNFTIEVIGNIHENYELLQQ